MSDNTQTDETTQASAPTPKHPGFTYVKSGLAGDDKDKVALHEYDPAHPENSEGRPEVWVAGSDSPAQKVAKTPEVVRHIREGELIEVSEADAKKDAAVRDAKAADRRKAAFEAQHPEISRALAARGVRLGDLMTGDASVDDVASKKGGKTAPPLTDAERAELETLRANQATADKEAADKAAAEANKP